MEVHTEGTTAKHGGAMHKKHGRHARGGKADEHKVQVYNAQGSREVKDAEDETPEFKKGGHKKRADGGHAEGEKAEERLDRAKRGRHARGGKAREEHEEHEEEKRGGHHKRASGGRAGHNPYSSGRQMSEGKGYDGHEGVRVPSSSD